jgi:hypothetical protein
MFSTLPWSEVWALPFCTRPPSRWAKWLGNGSTQFDPPGRLQQSSTFRTCSVAEFDKLHLQLMGCESLCKFGAEKHCCSLISLHPAPHQYSSCSNQGGVQVYRLLGARVPDDNRAKGTAQSRHHTANMSHAPPTAIWIWTVFVKCIEHRPATPSRPTFQLELPLNWVWVCACGWWRVRVGELSGCLELPACWAARRSHRRAAMRLRLRKLGPVVPRYPAAKRAALCVSIFLTTGHMVRRIRNAYSIAMKHSKARVSWSYCSEVLLHHAAHLCTLMWIA